MAGSKAWVPSVALHTAPSGIRSVILTLRMPSGVGRMTRIPAVIVEQDLAVAPARPDGTPPAVPDRDDRGQFPGPGRAGVAQGHELGARPAGEVVQVDPAVHRAIDSAHGGAHRVDAAFASAALLLTDPASSYLTGVILPRRRRLDRPLNRRPRSRNDRLHAMTGRFVAGRASLGIG